MILGGWPIVGAASLGSLGIPHNDGWAYGKIATSFIESGQWQLVGFNRPALVGQIFTAAPFHLLPVPAIVANQLSVAAWGMGFLLVVAALAWRLAGSGRALLVTAVIGSWPGFALLTTAFMTDVPSAAAAMLCVLLGVQALQGRRRNDAAPLPDRPADGQLERSAADQVGSLGWLAGAVMVGFYATTIRDQMLVVPAAVLLAAWLYLPGRRRTITALGGLLLLAVAAFEVWRRTLPYDDPPRTRFRLTLIDDVASGTGVLALALLPVIILAVARRGRAGLRERWFVRGCAGWAVVWAALAAATWIKGRTFGLPGNYLDQVGAYAGNGLGGRPAMVPEAVWYGVVVLAVAASIVMVGELAARLHKLLADKSVPAADRRGLLVVALAAFGLVLGITLPALVGQQPFDRYWMVVAGPVALLLSAPALDGPRRLASVREGAVAGVVLVALVLGSVLLAGNAWAHDTARWRLAAAASKMGFEPNKVDAGLEWVGFHATGQAHHFRRPTSGQVSWAIGMFPNSLSCVVVTADTELSRPWGAPLAETTVRRLGWLGAVDEVAAFRTGFCE